jgi:hypothetical protein
MDLPQFFICKIPIRFDILLLKLDRENNQKFP